jgi:hypothetical protein
MADLVQMTALQFFTIVGAQGNIIHGDPDGLDPRAVNPLVSEADAVTLEGQGFAERMTSKKKAVDETQAQAVAEGSGTQAAAPVQTGSGGDGVTPVTTVADDEPGVPPVATKPAGGKPATTKP